LTARIHRHKKHNIGADNPRALLTDEDVRTIRGSAESVRTLAKRFGVTRAAIYKIKQRLAWRHI
jgi:DNA invertase Pin-like site-specific DNA recombinase